MTLEEVWKILENGQWESKRMLSETSGVDDATLSQIINFLDRWDFAETRNAPDLQVRQKPGVISPVIVVSMLRSMRNQTPATPNRLRLAERIICRACGERKFNVLGENEVECTRCHEKQWHAIQRNLEDYGLEEASTETPPILKRLLIQVGLPQTAYVRCIPKPTRYYWFRCSTCKKTSTDYPHGHTKHLNCQHCKTINTF